MAAGLNPFFRTLGQALGIVIAQAAFTNSLKHRLGPTAAIDAASLGQQISTLPRTSPTHAILVNAFDDSLRVVWWVLFALAATMLVVTFFTKDIGIKPKTSAPLLMTSKSINTLSTRDSNLSLKPRSSGTKSPRTVSSMQSLARISAASAEMLEQEGKSQLGLGGMLTLPRALTLSRESLGFTRAGASEAALMATVEEGGVAVPEAVVRREIS